MTAIEPRLLEHAVLRAAAWPIETAAAFAAPEELTVAAAALLDAERQIEARRDSTIAALHAAVPTVLDRATRAYLLALKREVHRGTAPLAAAAPDVQRQREASPRLASLLAEEAAARRALDEQRQAFERLHEITLARQRGELRRLAGTSRFHKALIVANPLVAERWAASLGQEGPANARARRLEATVLHYLMRAAGRPTPHGAWAGVAPVSPGSSAQAPSLVVRPTRARYEVAVDLLPFALMLRALGTLRRYRHGYPLRLNPTLEPAGEGWRYERDEGDVTNWVTLPPHPLHAAVIDFYADGGARPATLLIEAIERAAGSASGLGGVLERLVDLLIDRDVLRSDLGLPPVALSVWEALESVTERLVEPDRSGWRQAIACLRTLCRLLAEQYEDLEPSGVDALRRAIEAEIQGLWEAAGLPGAPPGPVVRLDLRLPFTVAWSTGLVAAASRSVGALLDFHAADGGAELFRRQTLESALGGRDGGGEVALLPLLAGEGRGWAVAPAPRIGVDEADPPDVPDTRETILSRVPEGHPLRQAALAYCRAWEERLEPIHQQRAWTVPSGSARPSALAGPAGAVLLRLAGGEDVWLGPGRPEPAMFATRFASLLRDAPNEVDAPMIAALRERTAAVARAGVTPIEVVGLNPANPNAAIRPRLVEAMVDPHGSSSVGLRDLRVVVDASTGRPWLRGGPAPGPLVPVYSSAAAIGWHDRCNRLLLTVALAHGWEFLAHGFPASRAERARWRHLPRLVLPGGAVLSAERWTLDRATLDRLVALRGAARYLAWRGEAERLGLPALVYARCGPGAPELLLRTDSPLAVRCLFDTVAAQAPWLQISEAPDDPERWPVQDAAGNHYLAELAVSWYADAYWPAVVPVEVVADRDSA